MSVSLIAAIALATFFLGLYLGHRWGGHDARVEAGDHKRRFQRLLRFAQPYLDAHAEAQHWSVERNASGAIIDIHDPAIRCGTPALMAQQILDEHRRRKSLH